MDESSEPTTTPLERVATAIQDFVNSIDDEAPVLLRGGVIAWESVIFNDQGQAMYKVNYASLPDTSMASTIGDHEPRPPDRRERHDRPLGRLMHLVHLTVSVHAWHLACEACGSTVRIDNTNTDPYTQTILTPLQSWAAAHRSPRLLHTETTITRHPT